MSGSWWSCLDYADDSDDDFNDSDENDVNFDDDERNMNDANGW